MTPRALMLAVSFASITWTAKGEPMPSALLGNSIEMSWTETRTLRVVGDQRTFTRPFSVTIKLYISSKGRFFSQFDRWDNGVTLEPTARSLSGDQVVPEETLHWHFEGQALVGYLTFPRGARRIEVSSSDSFKSCSVTYTYGKQGNQPILLQSRTSGKQYELLSAPINSTSCSVVQGNVFESAPR
jgi:hypothetical protein